MSDADADADIQFLRRPETLTQLCDIVTYPFGGPWGHDYKRIAKTAAARGRGVSPELWAAGIWAFAHAGQVHDQIEALAIIVSEVRASMCGDYIGPDYPFNFPEWELATIAYMICPKDSPVFPLILYTLAQWMPWTLGRPMVVIQASIGGETTTINSRDLLAAAHSHPTATARLRAIVLCEQFKSSGSPVSVRLLYQAHEVDPTYYIFYIYLSHFLTFEPAYVIRLGSRMLNRWGLALEAVTNAVGRKYALYCDSLVGSVPELNGMDISLGDSSMPVFDYICRLETPDGSVFRPAMLTDMLPAPTPRGRAGGTRR